MEVVLRRSARARRLSLRVSRLDGRITLSVPMRVRMDEATGFVRQKEDWIRHHLAAVPLDKTIRFGGTVDYLGVNVPIVRGQGRKVVYDGDALRVPAGDDMVGARVAAYLKLQARLRLVAASESSADRLGVSFSRITIRDTRSRWGSCTSAGNLMYSWRLVMAPPEVLNYVAAHEVAHLIEMNHSNRFWAQVARICPDYKKHRDWLREHGGALHAWRFD